MALEDIYAPVQEDLEKVLEELHAISKVDFKWLSEQLAHLMRGLGKGIRPALTLLSGSFYKYDLKYLLPMAMSIELMHTATLVHDDAIDKADTRRGQVTINSLWGDTIAILLGDYLFAKAGEAVADTQTPRAVKIFTQTLAVISSGEINQFRSTFKLAPSRENYFQRIAAKTASLFALATESGALLSKAPPASLAILRDYGFNLGIAFQIVDDILDITGDEETLGKPVGSDLSQGTLTLPAMLALEKHPVNNPIQRLFENKDISLVPEVIDMIKDPEIIEECYQIAEVYAERACAPLEKLPEIDARASLFKLGEYILKRRV